MCKCVSAFKMHNITKIICILYRKSVLYTAVGELGIHTRRCNLRDYSDIKRPLLYGLRIVKLSPLMK